MSGCIVIRLRRRWPLCDAVGGLERGCCYVEEKVLVGKWMGGGEDGVEVGERFFLSSGSIISLGDSSLNACIYLSSQYLISEGRSLA